MLLSIVVETSRRVTDTTKRLEKIDLLARLLRQLSPQEIEIVVPFLSGQTRQGRIGIGYAALRDARISPAADPSPRNPGCRSHPPSRNRNQRQRLPAAPPRAAAINVLPRHRSRTAIPERSADGRASPGRARSNHGGGRRQSLRSLRRTRSPRRDAGRRYRARGPGALEKGEAGIGTI